MTRRILVVEDSPTQAEKLRRLLVSGGYEAEVARDGVEALERVQDRAPDLVVTDVVMPRMDGHALCQALKASPDTTHIPVIMLTSSAGPNSIIDGLLSGADNFIIKSSDDQYLLDRIASISSHLDLRDAGDLATEMTLDVGGSPVTLTTDKQQIVELMLATAQELSRVNRSLEDATRSLEVAKADAERANRAKSEFLSRMSHELRTPLNAVMGFGQLLEIDELRGDQRESVEQILRGSRHLLGLVNDVLDIARIEAGRLSLSLEPVDVAALVDETVALVRPMATERDITISVDASGGCLALADFQRLKQVLLNLLSNAIKYHHDGGSVEVVCEHCSERIRIGVSDDGPGIAADDLERLFEPFDRLGAERTEVEGTGLGLVLSRGLVDAMGGSLGVDSEVGVGSTFSVDLAPAVEDTRPETEEERAARAPRAYTGTRRVLYVEDNLSNLTLIERVLEHRSQVELLTAMQGGMGVDLARQHHPDLILLDVHLPDMNADEVLHRLQADPATAGIAVVILSADATAKSIKRFRDLGVADYLTKPLDIPHFFEVIDELLGTPGAE